VTEAFSISPRLVNPHARRRAAAGLNAPARDYYSYHDGFRILARRDSAGVRLITREVCMSDPARVQGLVPEPPDDPQPLWPPR
jgi:hypothetical protein